MNMSKKIADAHIDLAEIVVGFIFEKRMTGSPDVCKYKCKNNTRAIKPGQ